MMITSRCDVLHHLALGLELELELRDRANHGRHGEVRTGGVTRSETSNLSATGFDV